jgi:hypothetical protein
MLISEVYNRFRTFVVDILANNTISVIFANQVAPRPKKPFVTIAVGQLNEFSLPIRYEIDSLGLQTVLSNKSFLITLESYCDVLHQAEDLLTTIQNFLPTETAYNHFKGEMTYIKTVLGVSAIPTGINGINESRAILETEFYLTQTIQDNVGLIEHIEIKNLNTNKEFIINK